MVGLYIDIVNRHGDTDFREFSSLVTSVQFGGPLLMDIISPKDSFLIVTA